MTQKALILGGSGSFGSNITRTFEAAGWDVYQYNRKTGNMKEAANGMDVIVNAMNPSYEKWADQVPGITAQVIAAAKASNATVILPGNVYVYGDSSPERMAKNTPHAAQNPLGRIRIDLEAAYKNSGVKTILLRAGDFIDTAASGNWFDRVITSKIAKGVFSYPLRMDARHAWAYLPDMARAAVELAEKRESLATFEEVLFPGYTLTGEELAQAFEAVVGRSLKRKNMSYMPMKIMAPFWKLMRHLVEMSYLWKMPHFLDDTSFKALLPNFKATPLRDALRANL